MYKMKTKTVASKNPAMNVSSNVEMVIPRQRRRKRSISRRLTPTPSIILVPVNLPPKKRSRKRSVSRTRSPSKSRKSQKIRSESRKTVTRTLRGAGLKKTKSRKGKSRGATVSNIIIKPVIQRLPVPTANVKKPPPATVSRPADATPKVTVNVATSTGAPSTHKSHVVHHRSHPGGPCPMHQYRSKTETQTTTVMTPKTNDKSTTATLTSKPTDPKVTVTTSTPPHAPKPAVTVTTSTPPHAPKPAVTVTTDRPKEIVTTVTKPVETKTVNVIKPAATGGRVDGRLEVNVNSSTKLG